MTSAEHLRTLSKQFDELEGIVLERFRGHAHAEDVSTSSASLKTFVQPPSRDALTNLGANVETGIAPSPKVSQVGPRPPESRLMSEADGTPAASASLLSRLSWIWGGNRR
jgi:hypothetical protein